MAIKRGTQRRAATHDEVAKVTAILIANKERFEKSTLDEITAVVNRTHPQIAAFTIDKVCKSLDLEYRKKKRKPMTYNSGNSTRALAKIVQELVEHAFVSGTVDQQWVEQVNPVLESIRYGKPVERNNEEPKTDEDDQTDD